MQPILEDMLLLPADLGGRVSLSKNVRADPLDLERMDGPQLDVFFAPQRRVDPKGVLSSRFYERLFPTRMGFKA